MELNWFKQVGLSDKAKDEEVWRFCQEHGFLLLTGNRTSNDKEKSLEYAIRRLVTPTSLPVITEISARNAPCFSYGDVRAQVVLNLEALVFQAPSRIV
jgi:hypothetical protein